MTTRLSFAKLFTLFLPSLVTGIAIAATPYTGVVKSVDAAAGKIAITHQGIPKLDMPAMTMKFKYKGDFSKLNADDKVQFDADKTALGFEIVDIVVVPN